MRTELFMYFCIMKYIGTQGEVCRQLKILKYKSFINLCPLPLAQTKYFASVIICIFYTKCANGTIRQRGEHSPTARNM